MITRSSFAALFVLGCAAPATAQNYPYYQQARAATPAESYARGYSDVVQSAGQYNLQTSEAAINVEQARSMNMDNRLKWSSTWTQMRQMNREYRKAEKDATYPPKTQEDYVRYAKERAPKRLSPSQVDPITGYIKWPPALTTQDFSEHRESLDKLFAQRAHASGAIGYENYMQIHQETDAMLTQLKSHVRTIPASFYTQARNFIKSLGYEARFPAG